MRHEQNPSKNSPVSKIIIQAQELSYLLPSQRVPQLRPSSFPKCPVIDWMKIIRHNSLGYIEEEQSFGSSYFSGVGTKVHEIIQHHIGNTEKVYGNWKCVNESCKHGRKSNEIYNAAGKLVRKGNTTRKNTTKNKCPGCKRPMHYEELEITMKGITGHVDCVLVLKKGRWWVVDYKTCLKQKVIDRCLPDKKHLQQIMAYCYILKYEYGLPIVGFSLVYLPRDNPFYFYEHSEEFESKKSNQKALNIIKTEKQKWKSVKKSLKQDSPNAVIKAKPCSCKKEYLQKIDFYEPCPLLDVCFTPRLPEVLNKYKQAHDTGQVKEMQNFNSLVKMVTNEEFKLLKPKKSKQK
jgi:hypothetical protein